MKFATDTTYQTRRIGDHTMTVEVYIVKRTAKFATVTDKWGKTKRVGIKTDADGNEWMMPEGSHANAPVIFAHRDAI